MGLKNSSLEATMIQIISLVTIVASLVTLSLSWFLNTNIAVVIIQCINIVFFSSVLLYYPKLKHHQKMTYVVVVYYAILFIGAWYSLSMFYYQTRLLYLILLLITNLLFINKTRRIALILEITSIPLMVLIDYLRLSKTIDFNSYMFIVAETIIWSIVIFTLFEIFRRKLINTEKELEMLSISDPLTQSFNMRYFDSYLKDDNSRDYTLAMIDLNDFKTLNDKHGHQEGDNILVEFSNLIMTSIRQSDLLFRYGGDEFIIIFNDCTLIDAVKKVNEIKTKAKQLSYPIRFSVGYSESNEVTSQETLMELADKRMYTSKKDKYDDERLV